MDVEAVKSVLLFGILSNEITQINHMYATSIDSIIYLLFFSPKFLLQQGINIGYLTKEKLSYARGGLGYSFRSVVILSLYWKKLIRYGALITLLFGSVVTILWKNSNFQNFYSERFSIFGLNFLLILIVSYLNSRSNQRKINE